MGYYIKYQEMSEYYELVREWTNAMQEVLYGLGSSFRKLAAEEKIAGNTVNAIQNYIDRFHLKIVEGLKVLLDELRYQIELYREDYFTNIDSAEETVLCEDFFTEHIEELQRKEHGIDYFQEQIETILNAVSFVEVDKPSPDPIKEIGGYLMKSMQELAENVAAMEAGHLSDMTDAEELLDALNGFITGNCWQPANGTLEEAVEQIDSGTDGKRIEELTVRESQALEEMQDQIEIAEINEGIRKWEKKSKEEGIYFNSDLYRNSNIYRATANWIYQIEGMNEGWEDILVAIGEVYDRQKENYKAISEVTGIPPEVIAAIHYEENATDYLEETFGVYLHNGSPLGEISSLAPYPDFFDEDEFYQAAIDALQGEYIAGMAKRFLTAESEDIIAMVAFTIVYNGWDNGGNVSYAYNGTNIFSEGLYTSDYHYDPNAQSLNCGTYLVIMTLLEN